MEFPHEQQLILLAGQELTGGDHQRRLRARAITDRYDLGREGTDWLFDAIRDLTDLGFLVPLIEDGGIEIQPIQLTSGGSMEAQRIAEAGLKLKRKEVLRGTKYYEVPAGWPSDIEPEEWMEVPAPSAPVPASAWTGLLSTKEQARRVRLLAPLALVDIERLIQETEEQRFNDVETAEALSRLRSLHSALGDLLSALDQDAPLQARMEFVQKHKAAFVESVRQGAKVAIAAPALTLGVVHILSTISGVAPDSELLGTVYAAMVGGDALRQLGWRNRQDS